MTKKDIKALFDRFRELESLCQRIGIAPPSFAEMVDQFRKRMEELPIETEGITPKTIIGFIFVVGCWYPVHGMVPIGQGPLEGGIEYRIDFTDGTVESGVCEPLFWAHCTADYTVNYHWFDNIREPAAA